MFTYFPLLAYDNHVVPDILIRVVNEMRMTKTKYLFEPYVIKDFERADHISDKFYGHVQYDWVIYIVNGLSPSNWPLNSTDFEYLLRSKYGDNQHKIRHYEDSNGNVVPKIFSRSFVSNGNTINFYNDGEGYGTLGNNFLVGTELSSVTNREYEERINESKRKISILKAEYLNDFVLDFKEKLMA